MLLFNNQPTVDFFSTKSLVTRVWTTHESITLKRNGGTIKTTCKAYVKVYGEVWFDERAITNILALNNVMSKLRVTYDSKNYGVFTVQNTSGNMCTLICTRTDSTIITPITVPSL